MLQARLKKLATSSPILAATFSQYTHRCAIGWTNSHLHSFKINDKEYGEPDLLDDEFADEFEDSTSTKISDILPRSTAGCSTIELSGKRRRACRQGGPAARSPRWASSTAVRKTEGRQIL